MDNSINQRIKYIVDQNSLNPNSFAKLIGVTASTLSSMFKKNTNPGYDTIIKILKAFPYVDERWLLTGVGEMNRTDNNCDVSELEKLKQEIEMLKEKSQLQAKIIEGLEYRLGILPKEDINK